MHEYIVPVQVDASDNELRWAWRFTVIARGRGRCQQCGQEEKLDACHLIPKKKRPDLRFDPDNGIALCRSCHMSYDHQFGHRVSGRPVGYQMPDSFRERMREVGKLRAATDPSFPKFWKAGVAAKKRNAKTEPRPCENCGVMIIGTKQYRGNRFCSPACHYAFRTGKQRSGY